MLIMKANGFTQVGAMSVGKGRQFTVGITIACLGGQPFGDAPIPIHMEKSSA